MKDCIKRDRVKGFLDTRGQKIVNEDGQEILLTGWGLGNWLLCEGYMWLNRGNERFDRPRRIEQVIAELTGSDYAQNFWKKFRDNYIAEDDFAYMARLGYNSVRIPINARLFMKEEPGICWVEEGFERLDTCLEWCEKYGIYAWIDLHGAPGGQTGANIDDCLDDMPRLLLDEDCYQKGIVLWKELARRYQERWIVAGYDLLNEPVRPYRKKGDKDVDYLFPRLVQFYEDVIREIRKIDSRHLLSIEGPHWASNSSIFYKHYDPKMVIHFHRYGCMPDKASYEEWLEVAQRLNAPLWLGETGENSLPWFTAMYPLAIELGMGYNLWPWKKMECGNSPCSIKSPKGWERLMDYVEKGEHPGYEAAQQILDGYLENMKLQNCDLKKEVTAHVFRQPGAVVYGVDFDELPGKGVSFSGRRTEENLCGYRKGSGMRIEDSPFFVNHNVAFGCKWDTYVLALEEEFASYTYHDVSKDCVLELTLQAEKPALIALWENGIFIGERRIKADKEFQKVRIEGIGEAVQATFKIEAKEGCIKIKELCLWEN